MITLGVDTIPFFKRHRATILNGLNPKLAAHLARLNKTVPQTAARSGEEAHVLHTPGPEARRFIDDEQRRRCFYCGASREREKTPDMDRVMPENYAFSADLHNRVVACVACALKKRGRLPAAEHFLAVLDRNDGLERRLARLPAGVRQSFAGYDGVWYRKTYTSHLRGRRKEARLFSP